MIALSFLKCLLVVCFCSLVTAAPLLNRRSDSEENVVPEINVGDFVGVRPIVYERGQKTITNMHPGAVIRKEQGKLHVAMISKKLPDNPPQRSMAEIHPGSNLQGNMDLLRLRVIEPHQAKLWRPNNPLPPHVVANIRNEIAANSAALSNSQSPGPSTAPIPVVAPNYAHGGFPQHAVVPNHNFNVRGGTSRGRGHGTPSSSFPVPVLHQGSSIHLGNHPISPSNIATHNGGSAIQPRTHGGPIRSYRRGGPPRGRGASQQSSSRGGFNVPTLGNHPVHGQTSASQATRSARRP